MLRKLAAPAGSDIGATPLSLYAQWVVAGLTFAVLIMAAYGPIAVQGTIKQRWPWDTGAIALGAKGGFWVGIALLVPLGAAFPRRVLVGFIALTQASMLIGAGAIDVLYGQETKAGVAAATVHDHWGASWGLMATFALSATFAAGAMILLGLVMDRAHLDGRDARAGMVVGGVSIVALAPMFWGFEEWATHSQELGSLFVTHGLAVLLVAAATWRWVEGGPQKRRPLHWSVWTAQFAVLRERECLTWAVLAAGSGFGITLLEIYVFKDVWPDRVDSGLVAVAILIGGLAVVAAESWIVARPRASLIGAAWFGVAGFGIALGGAVLGLAYGPAMATAFVVCGVVGMTIVEASSSTYTAAIPALVGQLRDDLRDARVASVTFSRFTGQVATYGVDWIYVAVASAVMPAGMTLKDHYKDLDPATKTVVAWAGWTSMVLVGLVAAIALAVYAMRARSLRYAPATDEVTLHALRLAVRSFVDESGAIFVEFAGWRPIRLDPPDQLVVMTADGREVLTVWQDKRYTADTRRGWHSGPFDGALNNGVRVSSGSLTTQGTRYRGSVEFDCFDGTSGGPYLVQRCKYLHEPPLGVWSALRSAAARLVGAVSERLLAPVGRRVAVLVGVVSAALVSPAGRRSVELACALLTVGLAVVAWRSGWTTASAAMTAVAAYLSDRALARTPRSARAAARARVWCALGVGLVALVQLVVCAIDVSGPLWSIAAADDCLGLVMLGGLVVWAGAVGRAAWWTLVRRPARRLGWYIAALLTGAVPAAWLLLTGQQQVALAVVVASALLVRLAWPARRRDLRQIPPGEGALTTGISLDQDDQVVVVIREWNGDRGCWTACPYRVGRSYVFYDEDGAPVAEIAERVPFLRLLLGDIPPPPGLRIGPCTEWFELAPGRFVEVKLRSSDVRVGEIVRVPGHPAFAFRIAVGPQGRPAFSRAA